ncbi:MAG: hypothetical protein KJO94_00470 [Eudoraea sp.]|nr:hypothetical protein [Eudoraea sp.]
MRHRLLFALFCLSVLLAPVYGASLAYMPVIDDPIKLCKQILEDSPEPWLPDAKSTVLEHYGQDYSLGENEDKYILLESPTLAFDYFQGGFSDIGQSISKNLLIHMLKQAIMAPQETSNILAKASIQQGLSEYLKAYEIASLYRETKQLNYGQAIQFLDNRFGYAKLTHAERLSGEEVPQSRAFEADKNTKKILAKLDKIAKRYPNKIPLVNALPLFEEIYQQLVQDGTGIAAYAPFREFSSEMLKLNQSRINERIRFRSEIRITDPNTATVWTIPNPAELKWTTANIDPDKTIRFFLVKEDMVVQDLGTYKNIKEKGGIVLNKSLPAGSSYKVMGIEQFPVNKYHVAKFATPYFTIKKAPRPQKPTPPPVPDPVVEEEPVTPEPPVQIEKEEEKVVVEPVVLPEPEPEPEPAIEKEEEKPVIEPVILPEPEPEPEIEKEIEVIPEVVPEKEIEQLPPPVVIPEEETPKVDVMVPETEEAIALRNFFDGRSISYTKELVVDTENIRVSLWDHGRQDGDIVSIYLNGEPVVAKHTLTYKKKVYEVKLDPSKPNDLFLYAHNLGRFPPNTVSIEIHDGSTSANIILNSDLKSCEAVLINVKQ